MISPTAFDRQTRLRRDPGAIGTSLARFADQLRDGWNQMKSIHLPASYRTIETIAVCGMGGSHLGADIVRSAFGADLRVPLTIIADYQLPAWVNAKTLVICCSYSGSTEETVAALQAARRKTAKVVIVASGGKLAHMATRYQLPVYHYEPTENPSGQPRLGVAYSLVAMLAILKQIRMILISDREIQSLSTAAWSAISRYGLARPAATNQAKKTASALHGRIPLLIGAEWTAGNLHTFTNQLHENAKTFAAWHTLPDLNHHLLEGLRDRAVAKQMHAVVIEDDTYHPRTIRRLTLTAAILRKQGVMVSRFRPHGKKNISKAIDLLAFGGYVSWYLSVLRNVDPAPIPTVDFLKKALGGK